MSNINIKDSVSESNAGGMLIDNCKGVKLQGASVQDTQAQGIGGGILSLNSDDVVLENIVFKNNKSLMKYGGGLAI